MLQGQKFFTTNTFSVKNDLINQYFWNFKDEVHGLTHEPYEPLYTLVPELTHESYFQFEIHEHEHDSYRVVCCGVRYREALW